MEGVRSYIYRSLRVGVLFLSVALSAGGCPFTEEYLKVLFEGVSTRRPHTYVCGSSIDLETLFEDYPSVKQQFEALSQEERQACLETLEELNVVLATFFSTLELDDEEPAN